jgi:ATPase subunit of ABC transporter with duplicated ATPase domains
MQLNWQNFASKPDLILLDEPTNHMDIESIQWLEDFLINAAKAVVVISHDRAFVELTLLIVLLK